MCRNELDELREGMWVIVFLFFDLQNFESLRCSSKSSPSPYVPQQDVRKIVKVVVIVTVGLYVLAVEPPPEALDG